MTMKPILFNTAMVRAILAGQKTVTRRVVKQPPIYGDILHDEKGWYYEDGTRNGHSLIPPYHPDDILYVRESWAMAPDILREIPGPVYRADFTDAELGDLEKKHFRWRPSIHMPKEAARLLLRVTDVRVERLQEITEEQARAEGVEPPMISMDPLDTPDSDRTWHECGPALPNFILLWDRRAIKKADLPLYGWDANPWVWVIEFQRMEDKNGTADL